MKNLLTLTLVLLFGLTNNLSAKLNSLALETADFSCTWNAWFEYPNKQHFTAGEDVYVRVKAQKHYDISYIELFCNNTFIRKESQQPYEWCHSNGGGDHYLRNLNPGHYKLKAKIKDKCGYHHFITYDIEVSGHDHHQPTFCHFNNPLYDLHWLKMIKQQHSNWKISEYKKNGKSYFQVFQCGITHYGIKWYDCEGNFICEHLNTSQPCGQVSGAQFKKCWYDPCGNTGGGHSTACNWNCTFETQLPPLGGTSVFVKLHAERYQDISYIDLFVDNQFVRRESQYPYEWCKPNQSGDHKLRNLIPGSHTLKAKIKDKCGYTHDIVKSIYIPIPF